MVKIIQKAVNAEPVKIKSILREENIGKHFVIGPREQDHLRDRLIMYVRITSEIFRVLFLDTGEIVDTTQDIEVVSVVQIEMRYWV